MSMFEKEAIETLSSINQHYLTPSQAAAFIGVKTSLLSNWRVRGMGPPYVKLGCGIRAPIRYPLNGPKGLISYMEERVQSSTSQVR